MKTLLENLRLEVMEILEQKGLSNFYSEDCIEEMHQQFELHFSNSYALALFIVDGIISNNHSKLYNAKIAL